MKIGIITLPLIPNYGGLLQNYALQTILKKMGHDVITIDHDKKYTFIVKLIYNIKVVIKCLFGHKVFMYTRMKYYEKQIWKNVADFISNKINATEKFTSNADISNYCKNGNFDAFIVGSDQIWRPKYIENLSLPYLGYTKGLNVKRIAYAASFGVDSWEYTQKQTQYCKKNILKFDKVSVRELSAVDLCSRYFGIQVSRMIDPTLLLDKEDYNQLIKNKDAHKKFIYKYILDPTYTINQVINSLGGHLKLEIVSGLPTKNIIQDRPNDLLDYMYPSVSDWLNGFRNASFVICDSFHGVIFSIIYNKPFVVLSNKSRGNDRFKNLLEIFSLEDRLVKPEMIENTLLKEINWPKVNEIREKEKEKGINFLSEI